MNFDYLRLFFAVTVLTGHLSLGYLQSSIWNSQLAVFCFFCTSGYLITLSFQREPDLNAYVVKRAMRIYPPIVAMVVALLLFGLATDQGHGFLRGSFGLLLFQDWLILSSDGAGLALGVFGHGAFWTLVVELQFYAFLPFAMWLIGINWRLAALGAAGVWYLSHNSLGAIPWVSPLSYVYHQNLFTVVQYFFAGMLLALCWHRVRAAAWFWFAGVPAAICLQGYLSIYGNQYLSYFQPLSLAILVVAAAHLLGKLGKRAPWGDLSYGLYLYHFPVFLVLRHVGIESDAVLIAASVAVAFVSWHLIEKPSIKWAAARPRRTIPTSVDQPDNLPVSGSSPQVHRTERVLT